MRSGLESLRKKARMPGRLARALRPFCTARLLSLRWAVPPGQRGPNQAGPQRPVQMKRCPGSGEAGHEPRVVSGAVARPGAGLAEHRDPELSGELNFRKMSLPEPLYRSDTDLEKGCSVER